MSIASSLRRACVELRASCMPDRAGARAERREIWQTVVGPCQGRRRANFGVADGGSWEYAVGLNANGFYSGAIAMIGASGREAKARTAGGGNRSARTSRNRTWESSFARHPCPTVQAKRLCDGECAHPPRIAVMTCRERHSPVVICANRPGLHGRGRWNAALCQCRPRRTPAGPPQ